MGFKNLPITASTLSTGTPVVFSGSTSGKPIKVAATATPGTLIHTVHASATDRIYLYANNTSTAAVLLTIELGGTTAPDDLIEVGIPPEEGLVFVIPGYVIGNSLVVRAFAGSANVVNVSGYVERTS